MPCCGSGQVEDSKVEEIGEKTEGGDKYGKPTKYDPTFNGPIKNRSCTDIICLLLFIIFITGMVLCSIFGYVYGSPTKLIYPTDMDGNVCGTGAMANKPYLMFFDLLDCAKMGAGVAINGCPTPQVCVASCPSTYWVYIQSIATETAAGVSPHNASRSPMICKYSVDAMTTSKTIQNLISDQDCASYYTPSTSVVGRCVPSIFTTVADKAATLVSTYNSSASYNLTNKDGTSITGANMADSSYYLALFMTAAQFGEMVFRDIVASWWLILLFLGMTMLFALIWIVIMRWIAGIMVWITIFAFIGLFVFATYYCFTKYIEISNNASLNGLPVVFTTNFSYYTNLKETWLALGIISAIFLAVFLLMMLFLCQRIRIAVELIKEASRAIGNMVFTLFWPIIPFILQVAVFGYWAVSAVYIATMGPADFKTNGTNTSSDGGLTYYINRIPCDPTLNNTIGSVCEFVLYGGTKYIIPMETFMVFMLFWLVNFVVALGQMTLAGAFASYYWAWEKPKDIPAFPLLGSFWRCIRYHLGSLAFGSLIIALIQLVRVFLEYIDQKLKGTGNTAAQFLLKCLKCCFWCLEKVVKFLNRNAYIMIAVYGKNFCSSAKEAFFLIMRNIVRTVVLNKITDFLLLICKLVVTAAATCGAFFWFQGKVALFTNYIPSLNFYLTPVIMVMLGSYMIATCFFSVYNMAVDTLFLCFLEDLEKHDGSAEKPFYMGKGLMKILGKKNTVDIAMKEQKKD